MESFALSQMRLRGKHRTNPLIISTKSTLSKVIMRSKQKRTKQHGTKERMSMQIAKAGLQRLPARKIPRTGN